MPAPVIAALVLWGHALAALLFGGLALDQLRRPAPGRPAAALTAALATTALWALATAGIDPRDLATRLAEGGRNLCWLWFMAAAVRERRAGSYPLAAVYAVSVGLALIAALLALAHALPLAPPALVAVRDARLLARMMEVLAALVLVQHFDATGPRDRTRPVALALGTLWGAELVSLAAGYVAGTWPASLVAVRGFAAAAAALILVVGLRRRGAWDVTPSRRVVTGVVVGGAVLAYAAVTVLATEAADRIAEEHTRLAQTAIVLFASAALVTFLSTPWLRAWVKVELAKHLFRHRYDYRAEWQRFTTTLGASGDASLHVRVIRSIADLTHSPAGALLLNDDDGELTTASGWHGDGHWDAHGRLPASLAGRLTASGRIVELDAVRAGRDEAAGLPDWLIARDEAWALVPLLHGTVLIGAVLLARPPIDRPLDWEDFDLLRVAGRQAASHLAEDRARAALADAERFDEFNRRFAFILHDIKNLVSGLTLVARNAERHADNPEFRADMVATLQDSAARMNVLLARLSPQQAAPAEPPQPVDVAALARQLADRRRAQHPVVASGTGIALAAPVRLSQLLGHLVQNAIEASAPEVPVVIAVAEAGGAVHVDVTDQGCGMSNDFVRDQLFRPFVSSKPGGFGLGAHEARQLASAMGGSLAVDSREGEGTRFRLTLAATPALETAA